VWVELVWIWVVLRDARAEVAKIICLKLPISDLQNETISADIDINDNTSRFPRLLPNVSDEQLAIHYPGFPLSHENQHTIYTIHGNRP
jgi:hypothetical protein